MATKISEYKIVRGHNVMDFEEEVQEALAQGWQPMNRHGYESDDHFDYLMEMVMLVEEEVYDDMVADMAGDMAERDDLADEYNGMSQDNRDAMDGIVARILRQEETIERMQRHHDRGMDTDRPDPIFDDELFNNQDES
jgi:hypothetical protein